MRRKNTPPQGCIASYVGPRALAPHTRAALEGLGYPVVQAFSMGRFEDASWTPLVRLVDERQLQKIPDPSIDPDTPVILLTGTRPREVADERVAGRVPRPAQLLDIYRVLQASLEITPRATPRTETLLSARFTRADHRWAGNIVSLSEGGCMIRSTERVRVGESMNLQFCLPRGQEVCVRAIVVYQRGEEAGLVFEDPPEEILFRIRGFVTQRLATR